MCFAVTPTDVVQADCWAAVVHPSDMPAPVLGPVKEITVTVAASCERRMVELTLRDLAGQTAFELIELRPAPDGLMGRWRAGFRLRARHNVVGDAQIYALLRLITGSMRWVEVRKESASIIPSEPADGRADDSATAA